MGFVVFHVFQVLKIRRFSEQMKEADIVKAIMKYLKTVPGCFCWKEHGGTVLRYFMIALTMSASFICS